MKSYQALDHTALKAFYYAAISMNFTRASELAALTQSGISQHVAKLEQELDTPLFLRIGRGLKLTPAGESLLKWTKNYLEQVDQLRAELYGEVHEIQGPVHYAMPHSCLMTPHFPQLLKNWKNYAQVQLKVSLCSTEEVFEMLLSDQIDFGFMTAKTPSKSVRYSSFAVEEYVLTGPKGYKLKKMKPQDFLDLKFVTYPGIKSLLEQWFQSEFPRARVPSMSSLKVVGEMDSLEGARLMVQHGVGHSIFPRHCLNHHSKEGLFQIYDDKDRPKTNEIFIVELAGRKPNRRVQAILDEFWKMKA